MKYNVGLYGGSFDPLHTGHISDVIKAASQCNTLYIAISYSKLRDSIPVEIRYRWIKNIFRHLDNIKIILLEDTAKSKEEYDTGQYWEKGRDYVLSQIKKPVNVVFCGSDYLGTNRYETLYKCEVVCFDRNEIPVSSTNIRNNPFKYWEYIPNECKSHFVKRVLIVGSESTGKSTLAINLARIYNTNYLEEIGREVCDYAGSEDLMIAEDFSEILLRHKLKEEDLIKDSNRILFIDTDAITTKFYSRFLLTDRNKIEEIGCLADAISALNKFDIVFFLEPTVSFVQDGTRNEKIEKDRESYSQQLKDLFDRAGINYYCLSGDYLGRLEEAKKIINRTFKYYNGVSDKPMKWEKGE